jgi:hypothetical protein
MNRLFTENFELKKEIAFEKKRYIDLLNAFIEMRNEVKYKEQDKLRNVDIETITQEKL